MPQREIIVPTTMTRLVDLTDLEVADNERVRQIDSRIATALRLDTYGQVDQDVEFLINLLARERERSFQRGLEAGAQDEKMNRDKVRGRVEVVHPYAEEAQRAQTLIETERAAGRG